MKDLLNKWLTSALLCSTLVVAQPTLAEEKVSLNFVNVEIEEVVKAIAHISKRNFLVDPRVKGTINIVSTTPVAAPLAYDILLSALRLQGFAAVESSGVTKILPEADAKLHIGSSGGTGAGDKLVTRVYTLKHESAVQLVPILRPLIAPNNIVTAYPNNNTLVVTDYASNLKRIEQLILSIDKISNDTPIIIPVKYMSAVDLAQTINRLLQDGGAGQAAPGTVITDPSNRMVLMADARSNSLLLRTDNQSKVERVRELVEKLDTATTNPGNVHVVYLKNAEAVKMAQTLRAVMAGDTSSAPPSNQTNVATSGGNTSVSTGNSTPSGGGMIQADAASNSLIITASEAVYNNLRAVIDKLDVRRAQVFVEALVVEVTADKAAEFGVQWQNLSRINRGNTQVIGGTNFDTGSNIISASKDLSTVGNGLNIGIVRGTTEITGVGKIVNLAVLARALESDTNANILSTPNLLTLDNEEAKIIIGENVPFITGSYAQTGSNTTASPFQTIERKDVGLTLKLKPQVSEGGTIRLQIYQEVSSVQESSVNRSAGPTTNKRSLESTILADDGQIIVLGGLIQDTVSNGQDKIPVLGEIPVLGNLFRYEKRQRKKTNLMVFIRPYVLRNANASQGFTQDRYEYLRGEQTQSQPASRAMLPDIKAPELPPLELKRTTPETELAK